MGQSKDIDEIRRALGLRGQADASPGLFYAQVVDVDQGERTCTVEAEGCRYEDVRLHAVADSSLKGFCFIPRQGSTVLAGRIGESNELYVAMFAQVDRVLLTIGDKVEASLDDKGVNLNVDKTVFKAADTGFTLTRNDAGLKMTLAALCEAIAQLTVSTSVGSSSVPINAVDFVKIKNELDKYLEG